MTIRALSTTIAGAALILLGGIAFGKVNAAWAPCAQDQTTEICLRTMDAPPHIGPLQIIWLLSLGCALWAVAVSRTGARRPALAALLLVLVMNYVVEYMLWLSIYGDHWDVPPGTGYTQAAAFVLAGVLVLVGLTRQRSSAQAAAASGTRTAG